MGFVEKLSESELTFFREPSFRYEWDFKGPNSEIATSGLSGFESWGCWSEGNSVAFKIPKRLLLGKRYLLFYFRPYIHEKAVQKYIDVTVSYGFYKRTIRYGQRLNSNVASLRLNADSLRKVSGSDVVVTFDIDNPRSPSEFGSSDKRLLGLGFLCLGIDDKEIEELYSEKIEIASEGCFVPHDFDDRFPIEMYRLAYILQRLMEHYDIPFFFCSGTLLGAARHGGVIPWDDDLDMCLSESGVESFEEKVIPELYKLGWDVVRNPDPSNWLGFNVQSRNRAIRDFRSPYCDIFIVRKENERLGDIKGFLRFKPNLSDVFPTRKIKFGGFDISVPGNYQEILVQDFGPEWATQVKKYNHEYKGFRMAEHEGENFLPAGPFISVPQ